MRYRWFAKEHETEDDFGLSQSRGTEEPEEPKERLFSRGELTGAVLSSLAMLYSASTGDTPMLFFSAAVLLFLVRKLTVLMQNRYANTINNLLKGFSIGLFFGAIFLAFF